MSLNTKLLLRSWFHSYEEDTPTTEVYRPEEYPFPPSRRGRTGYQFLPAGVVIVRVTGPADRRVSHGGTWNLDANDKINIRSPDIQEINLQVEEVTEEILRIKK